MSIAQETYTSFVIPEYDRYEITEWQLEDQLNYGDLDKSADWSDMGCFKTSSALWGLLKKLDDIENPRVLIVTTKSGKGAYFRDVPICMQDSDREWVTYNVDATGKTEVLINKSLVKYQKMFALPVQRTMPVIVISHYQCFSRRSKSWRLLDYEDWDMIIVDEAHRMKEKTTQWTKNIKRVGRRTKFKHIMTGTGMINRPYELWSPLNFLSPQRFSSFDRFKEEWCDIQTDYETGQQVILGIKPGKEDELRALVREFGPRHTKNGPNGVFEGVLHEPVFTPEPVQLSPIQRRMYKEIKLQLQTLDEKGEPIYSPNVLSMLSRLRQICVATPNKIGEHYDEKTERMIQEIELIEPSSKLDALMDIIENSAPEQQIVVFSNFKDPIKLAKVRFEKAGITYLHMETGHNDMERYDMWANQWPSKNEDGSPKYKVFICTLQLGSESIDLTSADTCVFLDRSWSPKDNNQGISRIYRPGQAKVPQVIFINAMGTTDQRIEKVNEIKMGWFRQIFGDEDE